MVSQECMNLGIYHVMGYYGIVFRVTKYMAFLE